MIVKFFVRIRPTPVRVHARSEEAEIALDSLAFLLVFFRFSIVFMTLPIPIFFSFSVWTNYWATWKPLEGQEYQKEKRLQLNLLAGR